MALKYTKSKPMFGCSYSKAHNQTKKKWKLNLQKTKIKISPNKTKSVLLTVHEIRTMKKHGKLA